MEHKVSWKEGGSPRCIIWFSFQLFYLNLVIGSWFSSVSQCNTVKTYGRIKAVKACALRCSFSLVVHRTYDNNRSKYKVNKCWLGCTSTSCSLLLPSVNFL